MSISARITLLFAAGAVALATLLAGAPQTRAQMSEPSLPAACVGQAAGMEPFASVSSTATSLSVTFKDPMPSGYSATGNHRITVCWENASNVWQFQVQPTSRDVPSPVAGTTHTISTNVQDTSGNVVHTFTADTDYWIAFGDSYSNHSQSKYIRTAAAVSGPTLDSAVVNGTSLKLNYNEALDTASTPAVGSFTVSVAGTDQTPTAVAVAGQTVTLTLGTAATAGQTVTVTYTVPSTNPIQNSDGDDAAALSSEAVTNVTGDTTAPEFDSAFVNGATLKVTFNEDLDPASAPFGALLQATGSSTGSTGGTGGMSIAGKVVTVSHALREEINAIVRERLIRDGAISGPAMNTERLISRGYTNAEKTLAANYAPGDVVAFHRPYRRLGVEKGDELRVAGIDRDAGVVNLMGKDGKIVAWEPDRLGARTGGVEVYRIDAIELRQGDRIRWTRNDARHGLVNSQTADVALVRDGTVTLRLEDGRALDMRKDDPQLRHIDRAWASTVHAFQGRTVDTVIAAMEANHRNLTTQKTLYVEISRARDRAELVTDDRKTLRERLEAATGERIAALEAVQPERTRTGESALEAVHDRDRVGDLASRRERMPEQEKAPEPRGIEFES